MTPLIDQLCLIQNLDQPDPEWLPEKTADYLGVPVSFLDVGDYSLVSWAVYCRMIRFDLSFRQFEEPPHRLKQIAKRQLTVGARLLKKRGI